MEVNDVCLENIVAVHRRRVDVLVESTGVERGVVKVADGEGNNV